MVVSQRHDSPRRTTTSRATSSGANRRAHTVLRAMELRTAIFELPFSNCQLRTASFELPVASSENVESRKENVEPRKENVEPREMKRERPSGKLTIDHGRLRKTGRGWLRMFNWRTSLCLTMYLEYVVASHKHKHKHRHRHWQSSMRRGVTVRPYDRDQI